MLSRILGSSPHPPIDDLLEGTTQGDPGKWRKFCCPRLMPLGSLVLLTAVFASIVILEHHTEVTGRWRLPKFMKLPSPSQASNFTSCEKHSNEREQGGIGQIPRGIIQETSDLQFRSLSGVTIVEEEIVSSQSLLAMPVGVMQKETVDQIVKKFISDNFTIMLFHYDGIVDEWNVFPWNNQVIHIAAINQTKWWFAKRFLHPDTVAPYKYVFLWDEDIGVENFHAGRYVAIVEEEGLEISQPALDPKLSEIHHQITVRKVNKKVHRRIYKFRGSGLCFENSTQPPCTGWVEMMVPVFSRPAWRCVWYMIQNDLIHAWGLDQKLGHCAQGDPSKKVGVVDEQYVVHYGIPSLGGFLNTTWSPENNAKYKKNGSQAAVREKSKVPANTVSNERVAIRQRSYQELNIFRKRWKRAAADDKCWVDPF